MTNYLLIKVTVTRKRLLQQCLNFSHLNFFEREKNTQCQKVNSKTSISPPFVIPGPLEATSVMGFLQLAIFVKQKDGVFLLVVFYLFQMKVF